MKQPDYSQRGAELLRPPACEFPKEELFRLLFVSEEQKVNKELAYIYLSSCWLLALARYCAREFSSADSVARQREIGGDRRSKLFPRRRRMEAAQSALSHDSIRNQPQPSETATLEES